jgi:hypothetical protein
MFFSSYLPEIIKQLLYCRRAHTGTYYIFLSVSISSQLLKYNLAVYFSNYALAAMEKLFFTSHTESFLINEIFPAKRISINYNYLE